MKKFEDQFPANWSQIASRAFDDYMSDYVRQRLSSINEQIKQLKMQKAELGENDD